MRLYTEPDEAVQRLKTLCSEAEEEFARANTEIGLYLVNFARGSLDHLLALFADEVEAMDRATEHAARAGHRQWVYELLPLAGASRMHGPTPVHEVLAWLDEQEARGLSHRSLVINRSMTLALIGRFDEARNLIEELIAGSRERGAVIPLALGYSHVLPAIEMAAGNPAAAIAAGEEGCRIFEEMGEKSWLSTALARLGEAHVALGHLDEADELAGRAAELGGAEDAITQMLWRQVRASVLSARGEHGDARQLAVEAVAIGEQTDMVDAIGDAHVVLGDVLVAAGDHIGAATSYGKALSLFEGKGVVPAERQTRERLDSLLELDAVARRPSTRSPSATCTLLTTASYGDVERRLHLHRLEHDQRLPRLHRVALGDEHADHGPGHRRRHRALLRPRRASLCRLGVGIGGAGGPEGGG